MTRPKLAVTLLLGLMLSACVTTSDQPQRAKDPNAARDAYIQLGLGYLQEGETSARASMTRQTSTSARRRQQIRTIHGFSTTTACSCSTASVIPKP